MPEVWTGEFVASLNRLVGRVCWGFAAGEGTGSAFSLYIGGKVLRDAPLGNPRLTAEQRKYDAEFSLFVQCVWRIDSRAQVVCGAWDDNADDGAMIEGLRRLVNHSVDSVKVSEPALDVALSFSNGLTLRVFCDQTNPAEGRDNYNLFFPDVIYTAGARSRLRREPRDTPRTLNSGD